jgi:uncharacterized membrane protein YfcA
MDLASTTQLLVAGSTLAHYPSWLIPPEIFDVAATVVLGILAVWAREIYAHYNPDSPIETNWKRFILMIIPGAVSGFIGGEVAGLTNYEEATWLFALVIGYGGAPVLDSVTQAVSGTILKGLERFGMDYEKQQARREEAKAEDEKRQIEMRRKVEDIKFEQMLESLEKSPGIDTDNIK